MKQTSEMKQTAYFHCTYTDRHGVTQIARVSVPAGGGSAKERSRATGVIGVQYRGRNISAVQVRPSDPVAWFARDRINV